MCASPPSPRHAQPDWMGGGLVSRQMTQAPASDAISVDGRKEVPAMVRKKQTRFQATTRQPCVHDCRQADFEELRTPQTHV